MNLTTLRILRWVLTILPAAGFILAGLPKLLLVPAWVDRFAAWGYSREFLVLIGALELIGGALLLIPRTMGLGIVTLGAICVGAAYTHFVDNGMAEQWRPALYLGLLVTAYWLTRLTRSRSLGA